MQVGVGDGRRDGAAGLDVTATVDGAATRPSLEATAPHGSPSLAATAGPSRPSLAATTSHGSPSLAATTAGASTGLGATAPRRASSWDARADATAAAGDDEEVPRRIGRFTVLRKVGRGAMGSVYAAYDEELARRVAVKVLHPGLYLPPEGRASIVAEAQAMARLSHAHVVQVYELGEHAGGLFLAMEYVEGRTLSGWLAERPRGWPEVLRMFLAAGRGLAAAHRAGIVHRDFKPDNVLVDGEGVPRVADFGLARPVSDDPAATAGTPAYMSPEQLVGAAVDARSDQFSFCVALHAALYGEPPFGGEDLAELTARVTAGELRPRPATTEVPAALHAALVRGLASDPQRRYPTTEALLEALGQQLPDAAPRRSPGRLAALVTAGLVLAGVAWVRVAPARPSLAAVQAALAFELRARAAAARAEWVYPSAAFAGEETTIRAVLALEDVEAPGDAYARARAEALRGRFAEELAGLGERFWGDEATRSFARDYYAQALVFRPDHALALERSRLTLGQVAELRARAETAAFSPTQLAASEPLRVLATTRDPAVVAALVAARDVCGATAPATRSAAKERTAADAPAESGADAKGDAADLDELVDAAEKAGKKTRRFLKNLGR